MLEGENSQVGAQAGWAGLGVLGVEPTHMHVQRGVPFEHLGGPLGVASQQGGRHGCFRSPRG